METPKSIEAEQVVLAGLSKGQFKLVDIKIEDFMDNRHKELFKIIKSLEDQIPKVDSRLIYNEVEKQNLNSKVGREDYVIDVIDAKDIEAKRNPGYWLKELKNKSNKRKILVFAKQLTYDLENKEISLKEVSDKLFKSNYNRNTINKLSQKKSQNEQG